MADKHIIDAMWDDSPIDVSTEVTKTINQPYWKSNLFFYSSLEPQGIDPYYTPYFLPKIVAYSIKKKLVFTRFKTKHITLF